MARSSWCGTCGELMLFPDSHRCPPEWEAWSPDEGRGEEDAMVVRGRDAYEAARQFAERSDSDGDYGILRGREATVFVRPAGRDCPPVRYRVTGESVPTYYASLEDAS